MYLKGEFRDLNGVLYSVHIVSNNDTSQVLEIGGGDLYFGASPVEISTENNDTFDTIIKKSCTITFVTKDYIGDKLFADNSRNIKVNVYKEGTCIFAGYVEPNTFSQPYFNMYDEFSINCVDALTTLQYYQYNNITINNFDESKITASTKTFKAMLSDMFNEILDIDIVNGTKGKIYYDLSKAISKGREKTVFDDIAESELYIIGDEADDTWTNEDLLKEILQYLNLHIIQDGLDYYIFDWGNIKNLNTTWYDILGKTNMTYYPSVVTLSPEMWGSSDTTISIADVYNQIQVKCDIEEMETVIESPLEDSSLYNLFGREKFMTEIISEGEGNSAFNYFKDTIKGVANNYNGGKIIDWYIQMMNNLNWKLYIDNGNTEITSLIETDSANKNINQYKLPLYVRKNQLTPIIVGMGSVEKQNDATDNSPVGNVSMTNYLFISCNGNENDTETGHTPTDSTIQNHQPMIEYIGNTSGGVYSPGDDVTTNNIVFSGKVLLQPIQKETDTYTTLVEHIEDKYKEHIANPFGTGYTTYDIWDYWHKTVPSDNNGDGRYYTRHYYKSDGSTLNDVSLMPWAKDKANHLYKYNYSANGDGTDKFSKLPVLECELIIGTKRLVETNMDEYGNSTFKWYTIGSEPTVSYTDENGKTQTYKKTTFSLGVNPKIGDYIIGDEYDLQNTISIDMNLGNAEGTAIPIKKSDALTGNVIFRILGPVNTLWNDIVRRHPSFWRHTKWYNNSRFLLAHLENIILKDFECKIYSDAGGDTINKGGNDLIYMSAETNKFINKKDDIEFKFVTKLTSEECVEKGVSASVNLNNTINTTTSLPLMSIYNAVTKETAKAEEHFVDAYYKEYSAPKILLECDLQDINIDFRNRYYSTNLKKNFYIQSVGQELSNGTHHVILKEI